MTKIIKNVAVAAASLYARSTKPTSFFGITVNKLDKDILADYIEVALDNNGLHRALAYIENQEDIEKEYNKKFAEADATLTKKTEKFEEELKEAIEAFNHALGLKELEQTRAHELKNKEMEHNEKMFVTESEFTKTFLDTELSNVKKIHDAEIETKTAQFKAELEAATALAQSQADHERTVANAKIAKAKAESEVLYNYDISVLTKKVKTEVSDRYDTLLVIANKYEANQELLAVIEEDKEYFKNFSAERVSRSADVTDALIEKLNKGEKTVTVNVTEIKKSKKNQD